MKPDKLFIFGLTILIFSCTSQNAIKYFNNGIQKQNTGNYKEALADYNKAIEINSNFANAYLNRGISKYSLDDYMGAISDFNMAIKIDPQLALAYSDRGIVKNYLNDHQGALIDLNKSIQINPNFADAYTNRSISKNKLGDFTGALTDLNIALKINPASGLAFYNRGNSLFNLGDYEGACTDWSKAGEMGVKQAYDQIAKYCNQRTKYNAVQLECSNCNDIQFINPDYLMYDSDTKVLYNISVVNKTNNKLWIIGVRYRCLDSSGNETDSGTYEFNGLMHPLVGPKSAKRTTVNIRFPASGKIIFEVQSYKIWPCPTDDPC